MHNPNITAVTVVNLLRHLIFFYTQLPKILQPSRRILWCRKKCPRKKLKWNKKQGYADFRGLLGHFGLDSHNLLFTVFISLPNINTVFFFLVITEPHRLTIMFSSVLLSFTYVFLRTFSEFAFTKDYSVLNECQSCWIFFKVIFIKVT